MARYDYFCIACDTTVEIQRPITAAEPEGGELCPNCGYRLAKQYTIPATRFEGSGFYSTDNRRQ